VPARNVAFSLGAEGLTYLQPKQWEVGLSYRYLHANKFYIGDEYHSELERTKTNPDITVHSWDISVNYGVTKRLSLNLDLPFSYGVADVVTNRLHMEAGGLGDIRLVGNAWLLDPPKHVDGNVALGLGFKAPSGDSNYKNDVYIKGVYVERPVDPALQPGDGGWGIVLQLQAFQKLIGNFYFYTTGFYLINPTRLSDTTFTTDPTVQLSVPDQYQGRLGFSYTIWPKQGLFLSLGGRIDGIPVRDLIGGGDPGFRRPGYEIYIEPAISWVWGKNTFYLSGPVGVDFNREPSIRDLETNTKGGGGLADFLIIASYSHRF
jgi:hypothetical protein